LRSRRLNVMSLKLPDLRLPSRSPPSPGAEAEKMAATETDSGSASAQAAVVLADLAGKSKDEDVREEDFRGAEDLNLDFCHGGGYAIFSVQLF
jgi:hypothetical protein